MIDDNEIEYPMAGAEHITADYEGFSALPATARYGLQLAAVTLVHNYGITAVADIFETTPAILKAAYNVANLDPNGPYIAGFKFS